MFHNVIASIMAVVVLAACSTLQADSPDPATEVIQAAVRKSIPVLEKGAAGSANSANALLATVRACPCWLSSRRAGAVSRSTKTTCNCNSSTPPRV